MDEHLSVLTAGDVPLVSASGTPTINAPGFELARAALASGFEVSPIPGPCAPLAALTASGLPTDSFLYLGFLPRNSSERKARLNTVAELPFTLIFLEAPHRLLATLADMEDLLSDRPMAVARELTKLHEQIWRGSLSEARSHFKQPRGEFVLIVGGQKTPTGAQQWSEEKLRTEINKRTRRGESSREIAAGLTALSGWKKRDIYRLAANADQEELDG